MLVRFPKMVLGNPPRPRSNPISTPLDNPGEVIMKELFAIFISVINICTADYFFQHLT